MDIRLEDINEQNWFNCILMSSQEEDKNRVFETWVASNALSLAQARVFPSWITKGIYEGDDMVGFAMYGKDPLKNHYELCRLMIDYRYHGKGYGRKAIHLIIEEMKKIIDCEEIFICFHPDNEIAKNLYVSVGFIDTGCTCGLEVVYSLKI